MRKSINSDTHLTNIAKSWTSRLYHSETDLVEMLDLIVEGRSQTDDWHYPHVGDLVFWFFMLLCHLDPLEHIRLWHNADGRLVAYAMLGEDPSFDWQVLPGYEWLGIEQEALVWAVMMLAGLSQRDPKTWGSKLVSGSRQDNQPRIDFLEKHGFHQGGEFSEVNMLCRLDGEIPSPVLPARFEVRSFAGVDEITWRAGAQREVWHPWTVGEVTDEDYSAFMHLPGYERELDVVAVAPDGVIAAYVNGWIDPLNRIGDVGPVGALPPFRRQGLTRAVLLECLRRMQERGMQRVSVSTTVTNIPAMRLYESVGFRVVNLYNEYVRDN
jgi:ribosomal protein S18 acetylase RimI-like enzyme